MHTAGIIKFNDESQIMPNPTNQMHSDQHVFPVFCLPCRCIQSVINSKWWTQKRKRTCAAILLLTICPLIYNVVFNEKQLRYVFKVDTYSLPCEMPTLDPFDPEQMKNIRLSEPFKCDLSISPVYVDNDNILQFNKSALKLLDFQRHSIKCTCHTIQREDNSDYKVKYSDNIACTPPYDVPSDFFKIRCISSGNKELLNTILTKIFRSKKSFKAHSDGFYSVILFGMDSVSRNNAVRQIPKAVKYLQEELSSIDLLMYNRVGGHTFDNLIPILTGLLAKKEDIPYIENIGARVEKLPLIWKNFSGHNYATFFAEDVLQFHTFNFEKEGFKVPPTDHYMRPFWLADYESRPNFLFLKENVSKFNKRRCLANIPKYLVQINFLKQFINTYRNVRKFALSHLNDLSHQNINDLHLAEDDLIDFFKWFKHGGHLNNTFLIVFSDHGPRGQSQTHQSLQETNMPFLSIVPPYHFRKSHPDLIENMKRNAQVLTTHFDLFATLSDILHRQFIMSPDSRSHKQARGISLFRDIHTQRSCSEASIPEQFCMCYRSQKLNVTNDQLIGGIAQSVVDKINQLTSRAEQCAFLHLKSVIEARVLVQGKQTERKQQGLFNKFSEVVSEQDYADYKVVIETLPGNAKFFATSKLDAEGNRYVLDNIERVNRYNNQSHCVNDDKLKPLCYCKT